MASSQKPQPEWWSKKGDLKKSLGLANGSQRSQDWNNLLKSPLICRAEKLQIWQAESLHIAIKLLKFKDLRQFLDLETVNEEDVWDLWELILMDPSLPWGTCSHLPELLCAGRESDSPFFTSSMVTNLWNSAALVLLLVYFVRKRDHHLLPLDTSHYNAHIPGNRELMSGFDSRLYLSQLCTQ